MQIEGHFLEPDEIEIGLSMNYGKDDNGDFHMITLGFIFFSISFIRYL